MPAEDTIGAGSRGQAEMVQRAADEEEDNNHPGMSMQPCCMSGNEMLGLMGECRKVEQQLPAMFSGAVVVASLNSRTLCHLGLGSVVGAFSLLRNASSPLCANSSSTRLSVRAWCLLGSSQQPVVFIYQLFWQGAISVYSIILTSTATQ